MNPPLVIDTSLLVLYVVGATSRALIPKHKRLAAYTVEDYDELAQIVSAASEVLLTPNTLTETSNLAAQIAEPARTKVLATLKQIIDVVDERHVPSRQAAQRAEFSRLGLTDSVLLDAAFDDYELLTVDLDLYLSAIRAHRKAINFNHLRDRRM